MMNNLNLNLIVTIKVIYSNVLERGLSTFDKLSNVGFYESM